MSRLRKPEWLSAAAGTLLLVGLFLPWYEGFDGGIPVQLTGLDLHILSLFILIAVLSVFALVFAASTAKTVGPAALLTTPLIVFGSISVLGILYRWASPPIDGAQIKYGLFLSLVSALGVAIGGLWSMRDLYVPPGYLTGPEPELIHLDPADYPATESPAKHSDQTANVAPSPAANRDS